MTSLMDGSAERAGPSGAREEKGGGGGEVVRYQVGKLEMSSLMRITGMFETNGVQPLQIHSPRSAEERWAVDGRKLMKQTGTDS